VTPLHTIFNISICELQTDTLDKSDSGYIDGVVESIHKSNAIIDKMALEKMERICLLNLNLKINIKIKDDNNTDVNI